MDDKKTIHHEERSNIDEFEEELKELEQHDTSKRGVKPDEGINLLDSIDNAFVPTGHDRNATLNPDALTAQLVQTGNGLNH